MKFKIIYPPFQRRKYILVFSILIASLFPNFKAFAQDVKISRLTVARPSENAFGAYVYNNTMYYCIDRGKRSSKKHENQDGRVFLDLFSIKLKQKNKTLGKPIRLSDTLNTILNEGPLEISKDGSFLFYSRNLEVNGDTTAENKLGIYFSSRQTDGWSIPEPFPFNNDSFSVAHPTLNSDATTMVFSSDKKEGYGKSDLYITYKKNGSWTKPVNLGKIVNTKWSESFPYFRDNTLYFTSNREGGIGGMDLYKSNLINEEWTQPKLLEEPINSKFDDFCYFMNDDGKSGYFSSNRNGETDGIYYFEKKIPEPISYFQQEIQFCYKITDSIMEEAEDLEFTWDMGDGSKLKGLFVEHCYKDTGVFVMQFSVYEISLDRTYFPAAISTIIIDAKGMPVIEYELTDGTYNFTINNKWSEIDYDTYYWKINGEKIFESSLSYPKDNLDKVRLVVWNKKAIDSAVGIELKLK